MALLKFQPQWSPPLNGGSTALTYWGQFVDHEPQWSPPLNGGSIHPVTPVTARGAGAAMEPAAERREHGSQFGAI